MWPHKKGGINNNQHGYTCAVRCKVLFVQTGGQFKAHSRTCFPMKPSLVFYPFSSKYYHIWPLDLWREALPISSTARFTEARLPEAHLSNAPSNVGSPNFPGQLLHLSEPASALLEPTPRFRVNRGREAASTPHAEWQLLQVQPHGMEKYFRTMATAVKPTNKASGGTEGDLPRREPCPAGRCYLLALVDNLAVVLLESLVFFFCWVAEGFLSSCSSGSGAAGSRWSASELPLLVLGLSSSDLCLSLDILVKWSLGKLLRREGTVEKC